MAHGRLRRTNVRPYVRRITRHSYKRQFSPSFLPMACEESSKSFDVANWTLALHFFLTFHVSRSIYLLLNFNLNNVLRNMRGRKGVVL